ncbi:MAG: hypothetical protein WC768_00835 [Patescibacteria group bacterium]|jgi:hypothetical protein
MRNTWKSLLFLLIVIGLFGCPPATEGPPKIWFSHVPPYGALLDTNLTGSVSGVNPFGYKVAVYLRIGPGAGWFNKPTWDKPLTFIGPGGNWICNIVTGGTDQNATAFAAFLLPNGVKAPICNNAANLPQIPEAVAFYQVTRGPGYINWPPETKSTVTDLIMDLAGTSVDLSGNKTDDFDSGDRLIWSAENIDSSLIADISFDGDVMTIKAAGNVGQTAITLVLSDSENLVVTQTVGITIQE